ncbi:hypothetical protein ACE7GA_24365 [Roseomonas sp. CCTCC AB2023176]|uniref:hypothetical protein n=1 Tax=Roseomonas sp. CCTCC AB2023176 TaxID=3342640 RepID=UPI0035D9C167
MTDAALNGATAARGTLDLEAIARVVCATPTLAALIAYRQTHPTPERVAAILAALRAPSPLASYRHWKDEP